MKKKDDDKMQVSDIFSLSGQRARTFPLTTKHIRIVRISLLSKWLAFMEIDSVFFFIQSRNNGERVRVFHISFT